jgi:hypothetical protein
MADAVLSSYAEMFDSCGICWSPWCLHVHHLEGGPARKHIRENLVRLCTQCHENLHNYGGKDCLTKGHCLTAKLEQDPAFFNPSALAALRHRKALPYECERLPAWVYSKRLKHGWRFRSTDMVEEEMPLKSCAKGKRGELEAAAEINRILPHAHARRACQFSGTETSSDVVAPGLKNLWIEVKRVERLNIHDVMNIAKEQCGQLTPVIVHRRNKKEWLLTIRLEDVVRLAHGVT